MKARIAALILSVLFLMAGLSFAVAPNCSIQVTPADIDATTTGPIEILLSCEHPEGINISRFYLTHTVEGVIEGVPNLFSLRPPENNLAQNHSCENYTIAEHILRADGRGIGKWYDAHFIDNYSYAVKTTDYYGVSITNNTTMAVLNYTTDLSTIFRGTVFLSRDNMETEAKGNYRIQHRNHLLIKQRDFASLRGTENYTNIWYRNIERIAGTDEYLEVWSCSKEYDPWGSVEPVDSPYCAYLSQLREELDDWVYNSRNSNYSGGQAYGIVNNSIAGISLNQTFYTLFISDATANEGYNMRYVDGPTKTNVSFAGTNVAWTSDDNGKTWVQAAWTPDIMYNQIEANDILQAGVYVESNTGETFTDHALYNDSLPPVNFPITAPAVLCYQSTGPKDCFLDGTHRGNLSVTVGIATDPNAPSSVNHSLHLFNSDGTFNQTLNASFYGLNGGTEILTFDTSSWANRTWKMNITAVADDNSSNVRSMLTDENFTISAASILTNWTCTRGVNSLTITASHDESQNNASIKFGETAEFGGILWDLSPGTAYIFEIPGLSNGTAYYFNLTGYSGGVAVEHGPYTCATLAEPISDGLASIAALGFIVLIFAFLAVSLSERHDALKLLFLFVSLYSALILIQTARLVGENNAASSGALGLIDTGVIVLVYSTLTAFVYFIVLFIKLILERLKD